MGQIKLRIPDNWHCHLRQAVLLVWMVKMLLESGFQGRVLVMPNLKPREIQTGPDALKYQGKIEAALYKHRNLGSFIPVMTIQITEKTTRQMIYEAYQRGVRVAKVYPRYVTTNSENGVVDYLKIHPALTEAEMLGMIVCFHAEHPSYDIMGRLKEAAFIVTLEEIRRFFPNLKIVVEHISTRAMRDWVLSQPASHVRATITVQHLAFTADDVIGYSKQSGGLIRVHNACKPGYKDPDDRTALQEAVLSGDEHFFYGGDDAPHFKEELRDERGRKLPRPKFCGIKECDGGACGVFNTTVSLPYLIQLFIERGVSLQILDGFLSKYGAEFYGYPQLEKTIIFEERDCIVPSEYPVLGARGGVVVPLFAREMMRYQRVA